VCELAESWIRKIERVDFVVFKLFLALIDGARDEGKLGTVRGSHQIVHAERRSCDCARAGSEIGFFVGITFFFRGSGGVPAESGGHIDYEDGVAAFGRAILHHIFPFFSVRVFLSLGPRIAS
jgi:hypothetical protein